MALVLDNITANLSGKVRREKLHGRNYFVAPLSMIVPGVLNGSDGPILYTAEEGAKYPEVWNNMPIVVNHPKDADGNHISARDPDVLNTSGIGYVFRSSHDSRLNSEGWFDEENTRRIEPRIYTALERNQSMELSTGLFSDKHPAPPGATHNGVIYTKIAKNYRPDHLAILPDTIGACSVRDGCGLNVNEDQRDLLTRIVEGILGVKSHTDLMNRNEVADRLTENAKREMSFAERRDKIDSAFRTIYQYKYTGDGLAESAYIVELYDTYLIFRQNGDLYQHDYSMDKSGTVTIEKTATRVQRVTSYEPVKTSNEVAQPLTANQLGDVSMATALSEQSKKQILDGLITNCGCAGPKIWTENEREYLSKLPDERLTQLDDARKRVAANEALIANVQKGVKVGNDTVTLNAQGQLEVVKQQAVPSFTDPQGRVYTYNEATQSYMLQQPPANQQQVQQPFAANRQMTDDEWKRLAPPKHQQMAANYEHWETEQKTILINQIQANPANVFTAEQLQAMEMQMLRNLANLAGAGQQQNYGGVSSYGSMPNFAGAAAPYSANAGRPSTFVANEDADMATPEIDWSGSKKDTAAA